jgi:hypothetical protein
MHTPKRKCSSGKPFTVLENKRDRGPASGMSFSVSVVVLRSGPVGQDYNNGSKAAEFPSPHVANCGSDRRDHLPFARKVKTNLGHPNCELRRVRVEQEERSRWCQAVLVRQLN